jgi:Zn-dependent peptidase ImmA (M78 family)
MQRVRAGGWAIEINVSSQMLSYRNSTIGIIDRGRLHVVPIALR